VAIRERQTRNFLATLFISQGIPMLCAGDELGRTQEGNNNTYCQDNELAWLAWAPTDAAQRRLTFTERLIHLRLSEPVFHRRKFFQGRHIQGTQMKDLAWLRPDGREMMEEEWWDGGSRCLGLRLAGDAIEEVDDDGEPITGGSFLVLLNGHDVEMAFTLPAFHDDLAWEVVLDTRDWVISDPPPVYLTGDAYPLVPRSLAVLRLLPPA
ncbi:MAG TPA: hypothetical protein VML54_05615, partial [Candidatus Limnocylindrales bacterium]|nr:hypothetical protein [Candidatus Limnocylindrales bacterium]